MTDGFAAQNEPNGPDVALLGMDKARASSNALVEAAQAGDRDAFGQLVGPHLAAALGTARLVAGAPDAGADAVQEALLSAWLGLGALRDPSAFPAWFRQQVVRAALPWRCDQPGRRSSASTIRSQRARPASAAPRGGPPLNEPSSRATLRCVSTGRCRPGSASAAISELPQNQARLRRPFTQLRSASTSYDRPRPRARSRSMTRVTSRPQASGCMSILALLPGRRRARRRHSTRIPGATFVP